MDDNTKALLAGILTSAFYASQPPIQSKITAANVPPGSPSGTLQRMQQAEPINDIMRTYGLFVERLNSVRN